jgi:zinc protease
LTVQDDLDSMPAVRRIEVGGVPGFWSEAEGRTQAGLMFRVGQADETAATRGITHLVEHLAISAVGSREFPFNGMVGLTKTIIEARGEPREVGDFLNAICRALGALPEIPASGHQLQAAPPSGQPGRSSSSQA